MQSLRGESEKQTLAPSPPATATSRRGRQSTTTLKVSTLLRAACVVCHVPCAWPQQHGKRAVGRTTLYTQTVRPKDTVLTTVQCHNSAVYVANNVVRIYISCVRLCKVVVYRTPAHAHGTCMDIPGGAHVPAQPNRLQLSVSGHRAVECTVYAHTTSTRFQRCMLSLS